MGTDSGGHNQDGIAPPEPLTPTTTAEPGGSRELLKLAIPLILASSFTTIQFSVDRAFLSQHDPDAMGASMPAAMVFWLILSLFHGTAAYVSTFVSQYMGANRPERVGPAVWQGIYFALAAGTLFWFIAPLAPTIFEWINHAPKHRELEITYFRMLCFGGMPMILVAALNGFFSGRGDTWRVLVVDATGTIVHIALDSVLIFGSPYNEPWGIAGAGISFAIG
ncbi:MAG: MATE family efflux transporter, partial [Gemmataceae bacterium]